MLLFQVCIRWQFPACWLLRTSAVQSELLTHSARTSTAYQWQCRIYSFVTSPLFPFTSFPHMNSVSHYQLCRSFESYFLPLLPRSLHLHVTAGIRPKNRGVTYAISVQRNRLSNSSLTYLLTYSMDQSPS